MNRIFNFYASADPFAGTNPSAHVAMLPAGLKDERELLTVLGEILAFPPYSGKNFDAFWDCVTVLEGITPRVVALVHRDLPAIPRPRQAIYIETLRDAVLHWRKPDAAHVVEVWFPMALRGKVKAMLR